MTDPVIEERHVALNSLNTLVIPSRVTPIYPVRYAYANFFAESLQPAAEPPALAQMLNKTSVSQTNGYVVRLLRPGWIYIKEENGPGGGHFQIFKYEKIDVDGRLQERFPKYLFANGVNAQQGLKKDTSGAMRDGYPFVFVRKEVTEVSIAYSEHEWHPDVIDKMNGDAAERASAMQRFKLQGEDNAAVPATPENLMTLVEDYRDQQSRLLTLKSSTTDPSVKNLALDVLTTQASYEMDADEIALALRRKARPGEIARVVALHDPVGRQRDIAEVHAKLALWEKDVASTNLYPFTIGQIVNNLKKTDNSDLREIVQDSINWQEHDQFWQEMKSDFEVFQSRQQQFAQIYSSFMMDSALTGNVGSLDTYFKKFFCFKPKSDVEAEAEFNKLLNVSADLYTGILSSQAGKTVIEDILSVLSDQNAYYAMFKGLRTLVTSPQVGFQWSTATLKGLDGLLRELGPLWGEMLAWYDYSARLSMRAANRLSFNALNYTVTELIPDLMKAFGIELDPSKKVRLTHDELAKVLADAIQKAAERVPGTAPLRTHASMMAELKLEGFQKLFNWGERAKSARLPQLWTLAEVKVTRVSGNRYHFPDMKNRFQKFGILVEGGFGGLSAFFNIAAIGSLLNQTRFSTANPIRRGSSLSCALQLIGTLSALTVDMVSVSHTATASAGFVSGRNSSALAQALAPQLKGQAQRLGRVLAGRLVQGLVGIANFALMLDSMISGYRAWNEGNLGSVGGHAMIGVGATVLFGQAMWALLGGASTGVGFVAGAVVSLLLIVAGTVTLIFTSKSDFQHLLENCFWGSGKKYLFWSDERNRASLAIRLERSRDLNSDASIFNAYSLELQEFLNYLNMPRAKISNNGWAFSGKGDKRMYTFEFGLPNFHAGVSDIGFAVKVLGYGTRVQPGSRFSKRYTDALSAAMEHATFIESGDYTTVTVQLETEDRIELDWHYKPSPDVIAPLRYLGRTGVLDTPLIGMRGETPK